MYNRVSLGVVKMWNNTKKIDKKRTQKHSVCAKNTEKNIEIDAMELK